MMAHFHGEIDIDRVAPPELEAHADTTWNCDPDCYATVITRNRGAIVHGVWRM